MAGKYLNILLLFTSIIALSQEESKLIYRGENGHVSFLSDAPLEMISAESNELRGVVDPAANTFAFQLDVRSLKGFNSPLQQEHFYENYIESEKYPVATFIGKIIEKTDFSQPGIVTIRAKGIFKIHGIAQEMIIPCRIEINNSGFHATAVFIIALADHNISIPKVVYQKIAEEIKVTVDIDFMLSQGNVR